MVVSPLDENGIEVFTHVSALLRHRRPLCLALLTRSRELVPSRFQRLSPSESRLANRFGTKKLRVFADHAWAVSRRACAQSQAHMLHASDPDTVRPALPA